MFRTSSVGLTSTRSSDVSSPGVRDDFHHHVRLAVVEAAFDRRADAGRNPRIAGVEIERHVDARRAVARQVHGLFDHRRDALAIDVLHREDVHVRIAHRHLLALVEIADADEHRVRGSTFGEKPPMFDSSDGSGPRRAASGMPWTLPLVEVAGVFMSPCASIHSRPIGSFRVLPRPMRGRRHRPGAEAVVAAEHQRHRAVIQAPAGRLRTAADRLSRCRGCTSAARRATPVFRGSATGRSPRSTTV